MFELSSAYFHLPITSSVVVFGAAVVPWSVCIAHVIHGLIVKLNHYNVLYSFTAIVQENECLSCDVSF